MATREVNDKDVRAAMFAGRRAVDAGSDCLHVRVLEDGRRLHLLRWGGGGVQLSVGTGNGFFTDTWIYQSQMVERGWVAALGWDGKDEPEGWYRHPQSGRRRPDGDPSKEFVRP
jgi:hypothetical protein